jgi:polysaccharide export outer membrane protein
MLLAWPAVSCSSTGKYVWYTELSPTEWGMPAPQYVIGVGDTLKVTVYEQENISQSIKIRRDGRISLPLIGEITAAGKTPAVFAGELEAQFKKYLVTPRVTVNVEQSQPITVTALGEFNTKGGLTMEPPAYLIQAVAQAGGLSEFASPKELFVVRQVPKFQRIRFTYEAIMNNEAGAATFPLRTGDVIVAQ